MHKRLRLPIFYGASVGHLVLVLVAIVVIVAAPLILDDGFIQQIMQTIAYYTIAAIGLNVLVGYQGQVSLGHGALFAFGAYASALLTTRAGVPVWIAIFVAAAIAGLAGFLIALPTLRARGHYLAMVTIALAIVTFVVAQTWIAVTNGPTGIGNIPRPEWFGTTMGSLRRFRPFGPDGPTLTGQMLYFWFCAGLALIVQLLANNLLTARWGRTINAVRQSEIASETIGVSVYRMKLKTFTFSAVLAGLAGALFTHQQGYIVSDTFTFDKSVELLVFVILGGARSLFGPLIGTANRAGADRHGVCRGAVAPSGTEFSSRGTDSRCHCRVPRLHARDAADHRSLPARVRRAADRVPGDHARRHGWLPARSARRTAATAPD